MKPRAVIGIDVGGTRIKSAVLTTDGTVLDERVVATPEHLGASIGAVIASIVEDHRVRLSRPETMSGRRAGVAGSAGAGGVTAVGVVVPGEVDEVRGVGRYSANLGWRDLDLLGVLRSELDLPVAVGHDVRSGLLAEHRFGAAVGADDVLFVPLGTGIASAVLTGGRLLPNPRSGEIGHVVVRPGGLPCTCGTRGCLETLASARAIGARFAQRVDGDALALQGVSATTAADVALLVDAASRSGDAGGGPLEQAATEIWHEAVEALASVLAPVVLALGTETVLIGGGLVRSGETLLGPLRRAVAARLGAGLTVDVRAAALGDRAGSLGAGVLALEVARG